MTTEAGREFTERAVAEDGETFRPIIEAVILAIEAEAVAPWLASPEAEQRFGAALAAYTAAFIAEPESFERTGDSLGFILATLAALTTTEGGEK